MYNFKPFPNANWGVTDFKTLLAVLSSTEEARAKLVEIFAKQEELAGLHADVAAARNQLTQEYKVLDQQKADVASKLADAASVLEDAEARRKATIAFQRAVEDREAALAATVEAKNAEFAGRQAALDAEADKWAKQLATEQARITEVQLKQNAKAQELAEREAAVAEREAKVSKLAKLLKDV